MAATKKPVAKKTKKTEIMPEEVIENTTPIETEDMSVDNIEAVLERNPMFDIEGTPNVVENTPTEEPINEDNPWDKAEEAPITESIEDNSEQGVTVAKEPEVESNPEAEPIPEEPVKEEKKEEPKVEKKPEVKVEKKNDLKVRTSFNHMGMIYSW